MLTNFQLTNFKAFAGPEKIPIRPLTLIFGPNSSGKSSIFQCLLMLKQTIESTDYKTNLLIKGDLVDLGSYRELIHLHETERSFSFRAIITANSAKPFIEDHSRRSFFIDDDRFDDDMDDLFNQIKKLGLTITFSYDNVLKNTRISNIEMDYLDSSDQGRFLYRWPFDIDPDDYSEPNEPQLNKSNEEQLVKNNKVEGFPITITLDSFLPSHEDEDICFSYKKEFEEVLEDEEGFPQNVLIPCIGLGLEKELRRILHIGPMREYPERYFSFSGNQTDYVGKSGKFVPDVLINNKELKDTVNNWFDRLEMGYKLKVASLKDEESDVHELFALRLLSKSSGVHVGITDVGFGISQVLPVIVQSVISKGKTILIEQPEYHLHPRLQAELGDMFIESALGGQGNTFLIETHSEHLILRILRRIRETAEGTLPEGLTPIKPEDVAVLYVQPSDKGSRIINIPVNEEGGFDERWPEGFFPERAKELF